MFSYKSLKFHQISYRNPYNFCFLKKEDWSDFQDAGNLKFQYLSFPLSNFDKSWVAEIVLNWGTRGSCYTDHIGDSLKAIFLNGSGLEIVIRIYFVCHFKKSFMISLSVPSLKSIDQKMYKNHAVIF